MARYLKIDKNPHLVRRITLHKMGEVTDIQAKEMLHAIGADHKKAREYLGHLTYHAYRNYYDAGGSDIDRWKDLVDKGYA